MKLRMTLGLFFALLLVCLTGTAETAEENVLSPGALIHLDFSEGASYEYTFLPPTNGLYSLYFFPDGDSTLTASVQRGGEEIADGRGAKNLFSGRLNADERYGLHLSGEGSGWLEVARETLSRSFDSALMLDDGEGYDKLIARGGDAHWYAMRAETDGAALAACSPQSPDLRMQIHLFDESGHLLGAGESLASGTSVLSAAFDRGQTYYMRISAPDGKKGKYALTVQRSESRAIPESVSLSETSLSLQGRSAERLEISYYPENAAPLAYLDSSNPSAAAARSNGWVEGRQEGLCVITAYAYGGARSSCYVSVHRVEVESLSFDRSALTLHVGESQPLSVNLSPANATSRSLTYTSSDETVVTVQNGIASAVGEGTAVITAAPDDERHRAELTVTVHPPEPRYRALLIGQQTYASTVEMEREGSIASVESIRSLLHSASFGGKGYTTSVVMDAPRDAVLAAVRSTFAEAREDDISLIYLTCHGFYRAGVTFFVMADGSILSAVDLERELSKIPGKIVLLPDCCGSGGIIGEASQSEDILRGVMQVFQGEVGQPLTSGSKYIVVASAYLDQDSYRVAFGEEGQMTTVFARALCDAGGWSIDRNAPASMNADADYDGRITLDELDAYLSRRMLWYLNLAGDYVQNVCVYPKNDHFTIFARGGE